MTNYINTIKSAFTKNQKIIVSSIIPPRSQPEYEAVHGPITHEFPFVGPDQDRVRYTKKMNARLLQAVENEPSILFFDGYADIYKRDDGCFRHEYSDNNVHLGNNAIFLALFEKFLKDNQLL